MKIIYILILLVGLYFIFSYARFKFILSHADLATIEQKEQTKGSGSAISYIAAGDSTAVGVGATSAEHSYPYAIFDFLSHSHTTSYKNLAVSGATTADLIDHQLSDIIAANPDLVTISIGANDVTHWVNLNTALANYYKIIDRLTKETKAKIYITNVPRLDKAYALPWIFRIYFDSQAQKINKNLISLDTDRVKVIDIHSVDVNNSADQFHPSDKGYEFWSKAFLDKIKQ